MLNRYSYVIKISVLLILINLLSLSYIQAQGNLKYKYVSLEVKKINSSNVIPQIEKQTNIFFVYNTEHLNNKTFISNLSKVTYSKKIRLDSLLNALFRGTGLKYDEINGQIIISKEIKNSVSIPEPTSIDNAAKKNVTSTKQAKSSHKPLTSSAINKTETITSPKLINEDTSSVKTDTIKNQIAETPAITLLNTEDTLSGTSQSIQPIVLDTISKNVEPPSDTITEIPGKLNHPDTMQQNPKQKTHRNIFIGDHVTSMRFVKNYSDNIFKSESTTNISNTTQDNSLSFSAGINLQAYYKNWFIGSGLAFTQINSTFVWTELNDTVIITSDSIHPIILDSTKFSSEHSLKNRYQYVELPLLIGHSFKISGKCSFSLNGGIVTCMLVNVKGTTVSIENTEINLKKQDLNPFYLVFTSSIGFNYNFSKKMIFYTNLDYRTNLSKMYKYSSNINNSQSWWGGTIGIRYLLTK
jgi:hypothetical protein